MAAHLFYEKFLKGNPVENEFLLDDLFKKNIREGEEALMLAVLENGIEFFQTYVLARDKKDRELFQEAEEWILEKNSDWFFSFENICQFLLLDPDYLRQGLLQWKESQRPRHAQAKVRSRGFRKKTKKSLSIDRKKNERASA